MSLMDSTLFPVKEDPIYLRDGSDSGHKFIMREDTGQVLSCMTNDYRLVTNQELVKAAEPTLKQHGATLREAVSLGDGQKTVYKWNMPKQLIKIDNNDTMNPEVIIKNSYDGSLQVHMCK